MAEASRTRNAANEEDNDQWAVDIDRKSRSYDSAEYGRQQQRKSIYRWPNDLVAASTLSRHHAPLTVSLGPYHHGKEHLQHMEHHKERALLRILRRSDTSANSFLRTLQDVEQELWDSYDNLDLELSPHLFRRMMLLDGCFLLEILRYTDKSSDPFFGSDGMSVVGVAVDMLRLENQIPFRVLEKLVEVEKRNKVNNHTDLHLLVPNFYGFSFRIDGSCLHILDIYRKCLIEDRRARGGNGTPVCSHFPTWRHLAGKRLKRMLIAIPILVFWLSHGRIPKHGHLQTATRLHEAGIEFKKGEPDSGLTIAFDENNGVLTLPYFELYEDFASLFMNLIAFERIHPPLLRNETVTKYVFQMGKLISKAEDVSVLRHQGIVNNLLPTDEDAAKLFNAVSVGLLDTDDTINLIKQLEDYAFSGWNLERAHLNRYYFHNPWSVVSLLAALILLVLTIIQTVFSGMQALNGGK